MLGLFAMFFSLWGGGAFSPCGVLIATFSPCGGSFLSLYVEPFLDYSPSPTKISGAPMNIDMVLLRTIKYGEYFIIVFLYCNDR